MKVIGVDQSINSTGVTILETNKKPHYYLISSKLTRKQKKCYFDRIEFIQYDKNDIEDNLKGIGEIVEQIILKEKPDLIIMEAIAFAAKGRGLLDLGMLNGYLRAIYDKCNIKYITVPPTSLKKYVCANGFAAKDVMIASWKLLDKKAYEELVGQKIDDIADSYFLAQYGMDTCA